MGRIMGLRPGVHITQTATRTIETVYIQSYSYAKQDTKGECQGEAEPVGVEYAVRYAGGAPGPGPAGVRCGKIVSVLRCAATHDTTPLTRHRRGHEHEHDTDCVCERRAPAVTTATRHCDYCRAARCPCAVAHVRGLSRSS